MSISRRVRFEILRRDGHACKYCGAQAPDVALTVDHVIPVALGGSDDPTNLVTACQPCNAGKTSTAPDQAMVAEVDSAALLFARAMERAAEMRRSDHGAVDGIVDQFDAAWLKWTWTDPDGTKHLVRRDTSWRSSLERFMARGLDLEDLLRFLRVAMESGASADDTWKYFCGCCWREATDRQELARRLIEDGQV